MKIAVEGCCHGELDAIYETIARLEKENNIKVDLLLVCGDFQAVRNLNDLQAMAVPPKYQQLQTFYKYYNREKTAPVLTIFIGGNHEASNYLQELPYGGWVAPNIYYLGYAGVVQVGGVRIGGISGIYKSHDYFKGHYERPPYSEETKRSVYHVRNLEVFRLKQLTRPLDVFMSHDWPQGIYYHGNTNALIKKKPFFKKEIEEDTLGSRPLGELLSHLKPDYWFAAHLHVKFAAHVLHPETASSAVSKTTKFLALDKCLPRRNFLQVLDVPHKESEGFKLKLDPEWLTVLRKTNHLLKLERTNTYMPGPGGSERYNFQADDKDIEETVQMFGGDLTYPDKFVQTAPPLMGTPNPKGRRMPLMVMVNPQTSLLATVLELTDPMAKFLGKSSEQLLNESLGTGERSDSGSDVMPDEDSDSEQNKSCGMPSYIDSSMDVSSASFSNLSAVLENSQEQKSPLEMSEKFKEKFPEGPPPAPRTVLPSEIKLADDDDELLAILSAQKKATPMKLPAPVCGLFSQPTNNQGDNSELTTQHTSQVDATGSAGKGDTDSCALSPGLISPAPISPDRVPPLGQKASSFGMSSLNLDATESSVNISSQSLTSQTSGSPSTPPDSSRKRDSNEFAKNAITSTPVHSSSVKKFKRRNVSVYTDPDES